MPYELLSHTADTGIKIWGNDLPEVFLCAAEAMSSILASGEIKCKESFEISLQADSLELLFHDWLSEINYIFSSRNKMLKKFIISQIGPTELHAVCRGESYNPQRHHYKSEIKAVTYHQLYVKQEGDNWYAQVFFDL